MIFIGLSTSAKAETINFECSDLTSATWVTGHSDGSLTDEITIRHNFASAKLHCDTSTQRAIDENITFRCAGMWTFDTRRPDDTIGTVAVIEFKHIDNKNWQATFKTPHAYDRQLIKMNCPLGISN